MDLTVNRFIVERLCSTISWFNCSSQRWCDTVCPLQTNIPPNIPPHTKNLDLITILDYYMYCIESVQQSLRGPSLFPFLWLNTDRFQVFGSPFSIDQPHICHHSSITCWTITSCFWHFSNIPVHPRRTTNLICYPGIKTMT